MKKTTQWLIGCVVLLAATGCSSTTGIQANLARDTSPSPSGDKTSEVVPATMQLQTTGSLPYYLYIPENPTNDMPLIIYMHGGTNKREETAALLTTDGFPEYLHEGYYKNLQAYVAVPKLDKEAKGWVDVSDQIKDLIQTLHAEHAIDKEKVALTGHSMGGTGTYQLQIQMPGTFACIAPMSGSVKMTKENLEALSKTRIWAFVGTNDTIVNPESSREAIQKLKEMGADARITELKGATHFDVPSLAYKNDELIQWLVRCGE